MRDFGILPPASLDIAEVSQAHAKALEVSTGLLPGDRVEAMNGKPVTASWEISQIVANTFAPEVTLSVERNTDDETKKVESRLRTAYGPASNPEGGLSHIYSIVPRLRIAGLTEDYDLPADDNAARLENGDIILAVGDVENPTYDELRNVATEHEDKELLLKVLRQDADGAERALSVTVAPRQKKGRDRVIIGLLPLLDMERPDIAATIAAEGGPPKLDIPRGAAITAVDGVAVANFYDVIREIKRHPGEHITINWCLDGETTGNVAANVQSGSGFIAVAASVPEFPALVLLKRKFKAGGPVDAVVMGCRKTVMLVAQTCVTLRRLVGGLVSPKNLTGPLGIISVSYKIVSRKPFIFYIYFLGVINTAIAVFNFLPLPPLDGGLVVLLLVEKVRGAAFSERIQAAMAYTGWMFVLALLLYLTFNDIVRTFFNQGS